MEEEQTSAFSIYRTEILRILSALRIIERPVLAHELPAYPSSLRNVRWRLLRNSRKSLLYGMSKLDEFVRFCSRIDLYAKLKERENKVLENFLNEKILEVNID